MKNPSTPPPFLRVLVSVFNLIFITFGFIALGERLVSGFGKNCEDPNAGNLGRQAGLRNKKTSF